MRSRPRTNRRSTRCSSSALTGALEPQRRHESRCREDADRTALRDVEVERRRGGRSCSACAHRNGQEGHHAVGARGAPDRAAVAVDDHERHASRGRRHAGITAASAARARSRPRPPRPCLSERPRPPAGRSSRRRPDRGVARARAARTSPAEVVGDPPDGDQHPGPPRVALRHVAQPRWRHATETWAASRLTHDVGRCG